MPAIAFPSVLLIPLAGRRLPTEASSFCKFGLTFAGIRVWSATTVTDFRLVSVVERDDLTSIDAIHTRFQSEAYPAKMVLDVGTNGVIQIPQQGLPRPDGKRDFWSVIRFRGLDGRVSKYEEGFGMVDEKEILRTERLFL
jgi:hypothetical protein